MVTRKLPRALARAVRKMTEKPSLCSTRPAAQSQTLQTFPLLRRPRPPPPLGDQLLRKPSPYGCGGTSSNAARRNDAGPGGGEIDTFSSVLGLQDRLRVVSTPAHPLPRHHPTPTSPHRHAVRVNRHPDLHLQEGDERNCNKDVTATSLESSIEKVNHVRRGPPPFPVRKTKSHRRKKCSSRQKSNREIPDYKEAIPEELELLETDENDVLPLFSDLNEAEEAALYDPPQTQLREKVISRQNYLKLTGWFATHVPRQDTLNTKILTGITMHCIHTQYFI